MTNDGLGRIDWSRRSGEEVEAVVAMLINLEQPDSVRITPSVGDGGVDILLRGHGERPDEVWQVKRYAQTLKSGDKNKILKSLNRLFGDPRDEEVEPDERWSDLNVNRWHLVVPLNPTPETEHWLQDESTARGVRAIWNGLDHIEALAARYPEVIDYYFNGGRARVEESYTQAMALMNAGRVDEGLTVAEVAQKLRHTFDALQNDPLYRYELRLGAGPLPEIGDRPGLVFTFSNQDADSWLMVDLIARCAASVQIRPITVNGTFTVKPGSVEEAAMKDFIAFGAPFAHPTGSYSGEIDAPGGLGGELANASISIFDRPGDVGDDPELRLEVLDPEGTVLGFVDLDRVARSSGQRGIRVVLQDVNGVFQFEDRYDLAANTGQRSLSFRDIADQPVALVARSIEALTHFKSPNTGRLKLRHGGEAMAGEDVMIRFFDDSTAAENLDRMNVIIQMLATMQRHAATVVRVPDLDKLEAGDMIAWHRVDRLLRGETVSLRPKGGAFLIEVGAGSHLVGGPLEITLPLTATLGAQIVELGTQRVQFDDFRVLSKTTEGDREFYTVTTDDNAVRFTADLRG